MFNTFFVFIKKDRVAQCLLVLLIIFLIWWAFGYLVYKQEVTSVISGAFLWGMTYQIFAFVGAVAGLFISWKWGGVRSVMGRAIGLFSLGLLFQNFGQTIFSLDNLSGEEIPYPSIADIGYFGSVLFYILGAIGLARASGIAVTLRSFKNAILAIFVPVAVLGFSYYFFLRAYEFDWSAPLRIFLDFGYPFGEAIYISIALLTYVLSRKILGGIMKYKISFILTALFIQYVAEYNFLYQAYNGTWDNSAYGDVLYLFAYVVMALGLLQLHPKYVSPRLRPEAQTIDATRIWQKRDEVATLIVKSQAVVIGSIAWSEAQQVQGVAINTETEKVYLIEENSKDTLEKLVAQYERLFGPASREVCRDAVRKISSQVMPEDLPQMLR